MASPDQVTNIPSPLVLSRELLGVVADHATDVQHHIIAEETAVMHPALLEIGTALSLPTPDELARDDENTRVFRAVGFSAAHQAVRLSPGGPKHILEVQQRGVAVSGYVDKVRHERGILVGDFSAMFAPTDFAWSALHQFMAGELNISRSERGHGLRNSASVRSAQLMFVLAGSVGLSEGQFLYQRETLGPRITPASRRLALASGRPNRI